MQLKKTKKSYKKTPKNINTNLIKNGYIYFISDETYIKIGSTSNHPSKRLKQLQTSNPNKLKLIHYIKADEYKLVERWLHYLFKSYKTRKKGEWFLLPIKAVEWIKTWKTSKDIQA